MGDTVCFVGGIKLALKQIGRQAKSPEIPNRNFRAFCLLSEVVKSHSLLFLLV